MSECKLENALLSLEVRKKGAELVSLFNRAEQIEYIWGGNPAFWARHSPVLFPIVGALKNDTYYIGQTPYQLGRHGFARDRDFSLTGESPSELIFSLTDDDATFARFPFRFRFDIIYHLAERGLNVTYRVKNTGNEKMYFSVGGHPAFRVPFLPDTQYMDYYLEFEKEEYVNRWPISEAGLIESQSETLLEHESRLSLSKELFYRDALVLKDLQSEAVSLRCRGREEKFTVRFSGFPYLGIWAARDADFVCIEPWCGIADAVDSDQQLMHKEGINQLAPQQLFERRWDFVAG